MTPLDLTRQVIARVAAEHGVPSTMLTGNRRTRQAYVARQQAMWEIRRERPHLTLKVIGRAFGGRDHSTISHGVRAHAARMAWAEILIALGTEAYQPDLFRIAA